MEKLKVYVIGAGNPEIAKKVLDMEKTDAEIILVNSIEDIPLEERVNRNPPIVEEIFTISAHPPLPELRVFDNKGKKGHQRPYRFHK